jgi:bifunctional DNA-binding transcriptional regulator/antitoxin component of YhaV-PrlF toxin-antitoxin module
MSATVVRKKNQTTLPADVLAAAGIRPKDQVEWRFEDGEIRGRKLVPAKKEDGRVIGLVRKNGRLMLSAKIDRKDILAAIRADREGK